MLAAQPIFPHVTGGIGYIFVLLMRAGSLDNEPAGRTRACERSRGLDLRRSSEFHDGQILEEVALPATVFQQYRVDDTYGPFAAGSHTKGT